MDIERVVDIAAPLETVWPVPIDVGSRARVRQPRLPAVVWTVTALEPNRYFEWQNVGPGLKTVAGHRVEPRGSDGARVTLSFGWSGPLAPLIRLLYERLSRRYVEMKAQGLKRRCEAP